MDKNSLIQKTLKKILVAYYIDKIDTYIAKNSDADIKNWITIKGTHIPVYKNETEEDAIQRFIDDKSTGGYSDKNKSNRSIAAELSGKDNATNLAKKLNIPSKDIKYLYSDEWHHTNKNYTKTKYYYTDAFIDIKEKGDISKETIEKYDLTDIQVKGIKNSWKEYQKIKSSSETNESYTEKLKTKFNNPRVDEAIKEALSRKEYRKISPLAGSIRGMLPEILKGNKEEEKHLESTIQWYIDRWNK